MATAPSEPPIPTPQPAVAFSNPEPDQSPETTVPVSRPVIDLTHWTCVGLFVAAADIMIFRMQGFAGPALFAIVAPILIGFGVRAKGTNWLSLTLAGILVLSAVRLAWQGSVVLAYSTMFVMAAFSMSLHRVTPYALDIIVYLYELPFLGVRNFLMRASRKVRLPGRPADPRSLAIILPLVACVIFGTFFIMANPDLRTTVGQGIERFSKAAADWLERFSTGEVAFWGLMAIVALGAMLPVVRRFPLHSPADVIDNTRSFDDAEDTLPQHLYIGFRNTLIAVIALFAAYLVFEFQSLWFREFPEGFYYAGYAHEGAAWLTAALGLSTLTLSVIFRRTLSQCQSLQKLRRLGIVWSILNFILAVAVYHRMEIYIDFNGMTRMRVVGLSGITCVVVGFALVVWKIVRSKSFFWLVQRQLWALALVMMIYLLTPVDALVHAYNVRQIMNGDIAPIVQITEHPISSEGFLILPPLVQAPDPIVREGIGAMLAEEQLRITAIAQEQSKLGWSATQGSDQWLARHLTELEPYWKPYLADETMREKAYQKLRKYAYQWY